MKKIFQIQGLEDFIGGFDLANIFNVENDKTLNDPYQLTYNINNTLVFKNMAETPASYFTTYIPRNLDAWPLISYNEYGTTRLWWLICKVNNIADPTQEPYEFEWLKLLKKQKVNEILNQFRRSLKV